MENHPRPAPPRWALRFLRWFCDPELLEDIEGDLMELFTESRGRSQRWYVFQVILLFRPGIIRPLFSRSKTQTIMVNHYLKTAWRHAARYKAHTILNLVGLIIGITSSFLLFLWIGAEKSVDSFHVNADRTVSMWRNMYQTSGGVNTTPAIPQPMENVLENEYPEVDEVTLLSWPMELPLTYEEHQSYYDGFYVSPEFLSIFSFEWLYGNEKQALIDNSHIVITDKMAESVFGEGNATEALGKTVLININEPFTVSGIVRDPGPNSSIQFDMLLPAQKFIEENDWVESWYNGGFRMFFTIKEGVSLASLQEKMEGEVNRHTDNGTDERIFLQPFDEAYLYGSFENGVPVGGRIDYLKILTVTAIFLLLIAGINYTNLTTARSGRRAREIGLRKMFGAKGSSISSQFYTESFLIIFISVAISLGIAYLLIPYFNQVAGKSLVIHWNDPDLWLMIAGIIFGLTIVSGFYPSMVMPTFRIISSLKKAVVPGRGKAIFRRSLVVFQFALSLILIIGMLVVASQLNFVLNKDLGLNKDNRIAVPMENFSVDQKILFRKLAQEDPEIASVCITSSNPLSTGWSTGSADWDGKDPDMVAEINVMNVDEYFMETMQIELLEGRYFTGNPGMDSSSFLINEVAADLMGLGKPVGANLRMWGTSGTIIGVVKNFHMSNLYSPIDPLIIRYDPAGTYVAIAHVPNPGEGLAQLREINKKIAPDVPFKYAFLDEDFAAEYRSEQSVGTLMKIFAGISIFIACLGLYGLISFSNEQRRQEIGIRKVMGASSSGLVVLLSREYLKLLLLSFILASPVAWYLSTDWLNNFAFHMDMGAGIFVQAGLILILIGALTTGIKSYTSAQLNPVDSIRDE